MRKNILLTFLIILFSFVSTGQAPEKPTSGEIYNKIKRLNFLGNVLYVAAHPDDENTRLISYLSNHVYARTAYLSLTRGDGGQNLVGPEIRELLGLIRTHELLQARKIDGGEQFFSRANDFGYSKHPDETLEFWEEDEVVSDVVWTIRKFRPDVIINRFDHKTPGRTHGHHTASAMLSLQAFDISSDESKFPEQLKYVGTWQPKRVFFNTSWWFYGSREAFEKADKSEMISVPTGIYDPLTGLSNLEVASLSRSMHKTQGFGNTGSRGESSEYLEFIKGEKPGSFNSIFEGVNTRWSRVEGGEAIGEILYAVEKDFDFKTPSKSIPKLIEALQLIRKLQDPFWRDQKTKEIVDIIEDCAGLYLEVVSSEETVAPGGSTKLNLEMVNRSMIDIQIKKAVYLPKEQEIVSELKLGFNKKETAEADVQIDGDAEIETPYWLRSQNNSPGMYEVKEQNMRGLPVNPDPYAVDFHLTINGVDFVVRKPIVYKRNDPVKGEVYKPFSIVPLAGVRLDQDVFVFDDTEPTKVLMHIRAGRDSISGSANLVFNDPNTNWTVEPQQIPVNLAKKGEEVSVEFTVTPPEGQTIVEFQPQMTIQLGAKKLMLTDEIISLDYDHIPNLTFALPSRAKAVKLDIRKKGNKIGYIPGAGDVIPESLEQIGFEVEELTTSEITATSISEYDAVVLGIRAYNTNDVLNYKQKELFEYVNKGGTVVVQYNTSHRLKVDKVAPYPLTLSRDRVTDEFAEVKILASDHPVMNAPNKITQKDFEGWVQERGLYFPNEWDETFTPILSCHDEGEEERKGGLLVAKYGEGYFIYTGYSWFRQFPAGVPGAYRIFANLVSIGK